MSDARANDDDYSLDDFDYGVSYDGDSQPEPLAELRTEATTATEFIVAIEPAAAIEERRLCPTRTNRQKTGNLQNAWERLMPELADAYIESFSNGGPQLQAISPKEEPCECPLPKTIRKVECVYLTGIQDIYGIIEFLY